MRLHRENIVPLALGLVVLVASGMSGDWSPWVEGFFGILMLLFVLFGRQQLSLGTSWASPNRWFAVFLVAVALASAWSANYYFSIRTWSIFFMGFVVFLVAQTLTPKHGGTLVRWFTGVAGVGAAWALVDQWRSGVSRAGGFLENANALGSYLIIALPLGVGIALHAKGRARWFWWVVTSIIAIALLRTYSLTGWVSLVVAAGLALALGGYRFVRARTVRWVAVSLLLIVCSVVGLRSVQLHSLRAGIRLDQVITAAHFENSFSQRWLFIRSSLDMVRTHPLVGVGAGAFQQVYPQYAHSLHEQPRYAHNAYLEVAAESGAVTGVLFIVLLVFVARAAGRRSAEGHADFPYFPWVALAVGASAVHALTDFGWHFPVVWFGFWILAGLLIGPSNHPQQRGDRIAVWVLGVLVVLLACRALGVAYSFTPFQRAETAMREGRPRDAARYFQQGLRWDPNPQRRNHLAEAQWQNAQGNADLLREASASIHQALRWAPTDYNAHRMAGRIALAQEDLNGADAAYRRAVTLDRSFHPDIAGEYMAFLIQHQRFADARRVAQDILSAYDANPWTNNPFVEGDVSAIRTALKSIEGKE